MLNSQDCERQEDHFGSENILSRSLPKEVQVYRLTDPPTNSCPVSVASGSESLSTVSSPVLRRSHSVGHLGYPLASASDTASLCSIESMEQLEVCPGIEKAPSRPSSTVSEVSVKLYSRFLKTIQKSMRLFFRCVRSEPHAHDESCCVTAATAGDASTSELDEMDVPFRYVQESSENLVAKEENSEATAVEIPKVVTIPWIDSPDETMDDTGAFQSPITNLSEHDEEVAVDSTALRFILEPTLEASSHHCQSPISLLPPVHPIDFGKKCLVLDLDETLVHSTFQIVPADLVTPVQLGEGVVQPIYVNKRPGVDVFLERVCDLFEVVIFTASISAYANPVIDFLDVNRKIRHRLYREACVHRQGLFIKDLGRLGRPLDQTLIVDNAPSSYILNPHNALAIKSWFSDPDDQDLLQVILPRLLSLAESTDVYAWRKMMMMMHSVRYN